MRPGFARQPPIIPGVTDHRNVALSQFTVSMRKVVEVADLAALWRELEGRADASFFLSWDWIGCWMRETGVSPYLLRVTNGDGVVGLALLQPSHRRRHMLVGADALMLQQAGNPDLDDITIEHNDILVDRSVGEAAKLACLEFLTQQGGVMWDELHLGGVSSPESFRPMAERTGLMMSYQNYARSWAVDLVAVRAAGGQYLDGLSANTRYQIRRAIRLYEKRGALTATPAASVDEAMGYFTHMKELHQRYWTGRGFLGSFATPFFEQFHRALISACLPRGTVELVCVRVNGQPIGYVYNFIHDGWVCAYQTGFLYESDAKLKPGLVSHYLCIMRHIEAGARRYDFLAGGDRYKASLARPGPDIAHLVLQRPLLKLRVENSARQLKQGLLTVLQGSATGGIGLNRGPPGVFGGLGQEQTGSLLEALRRRLFGPGATVAGRASGRGPGAEDVAGRLAGKRGRARVSAKGTGGRRKVLVLGDDTRSFLAIARSLGRQGIEVHAAPANFSSFALRSRFVARTHFVPYWMGDGSEWREAMEALLRAERFDLVIPCDETTLLPLQHHRADFERLTRLAIPGDRAIEVLFDKHATRELARSLGVAVSPGRLPAPGETAEAVLAELGVPVVVKPRRSYSVDKLHSRGKVRIVREAGELAGMLPGLDPEEFVYETFRPGRGAGVSVLASQGRLLQVFEHHRVRETVAGSYYRVSAPVTPALEAAVAAIVAALDYTGVAMFEFRLTDGGAGEAPGSKPGAWILLEVNARPWGSMPLPVALGVDFPWLWFQLLVDGVEAPRRTYRTGVFGRNLIPDFWSTVHELRRHPRGVVAAAGLGALRMLELGRGLTDREVHDVLVRDDPAPGLLEMRAIGEEIGGRVTRRVSGPSARRRGMRARQVLGTALDRATLGKHGETGGAGRSGPSNAGLMLARAGSASPTRGPSLEGREDVASVVQPTALPIVLFVCQGNINRSPFAEAALRARLGDGGVEVGSFGMLPQPGRPTPGFGIEAADERGLDLRGHRSRHLTREAAEGAAVIFIFDEINARAIENRYPGLRTPVLLLGDFGPRPIGGIVDPVDGDPALYGRVYDEILACVGPVAAVVSDHVAGGR